MFTSKAAARGRSFEELAGAWQRLAERRRDHLNEMQRSGRWMRYFSEERMAAHCEDAQACIVAWSELAGAQRARPKVPASTLPVAATASDTADAA